MSERGLLKVATIRVLYADTDQMAIVNNAVYLNWFEIGRAEWLRQTGISYAAVEADGFRLPVVEANLRYRQPARYDDLIDIEATPDMVKAATVRFRYCIRRQQDGLLLTEGYTTHACIDFEGRVRRFPEKYLKLLGA